MIGLTKEQFEVIMHDDGNILVSASAGSGKTHTMIERIKRLVIKQGVSVNNILAVTFTEASAFDMKSKLKNAFIDVIGGKLNTEIFCRIDQSKILECEKQLSDIATADISTLHAFCGKIIRNYFFVAGVSPDFRIIDQADANVLKSQAIEKTFKELYEKGEQNFLTLIDRHSTDRTDRAIKELVLSVYDFCFSEAQPFEFADKFEYLYSQEGFEEVLFEYKQALDRQIMPFVHKIAFALETFKKDGLVKGVEFAKTLLADVIAVCDCENIYQVKPFENYKIKLDFERKLTQDSLEQKQVVAQIRDKFVKILKRFLACVGKDKEQDLIKNKVCFSHTRTLVDIVKKFSENYASVKREENALDFSDLEHFALKVLENEQVIEVLKNKYKYVFVDEYQDTNGVQEKIISLIANDNLFMVGDVKQSIYGFRGCRSEFFTKKDLVMSQNGEKVVRLNHNFRSAKAVIKMVNTIFNFCMTKDVYGEEYRGVSELISGGIYPEEYEGRAQLHFLKKDDKAEKKIEQPRVYDLLKENPQEQQSDAGKTASLIAQIIEDELGKKFYDPKTSQFKQVSYGDIAILTRNRKKEIVKGLIQNGIPIGSDVADNVCDYPEIKVMINALKLADCFLQDLPLVSTLKSAIGGFTEEELFEVVRFYEQEKPKEYGGFSDAFAFYVENAETPLSNRLKEFKKYFDSVRLSSDFIGAQGVLQKLISDKSVDAYLFAQPNGVAKVDRLKRFVFASVVGDKLLTVREFLDRIANCPEAFGLTPFSCEDTVKIMTIHSSKGLEFPVVIVCGLDSQFNAEDEREEVLADRQFGLAVKYYQDDVRVKEETLLRGLIRENMRSERIREEMRLFYVATTRATYSLHLIISGKEDPRLSEFNGANKFSDFIPQFIPATQTTQSELALGFNPVGNRKVIIVKPDDNAVEQIKKAIDYTYPFESDTSLPLKGSVTAFAKTESDEVYSKVLFDEQTPDAESGTIAHKILENFDFEQGDLLAQVEEMIKKGVVNEQQVSRINLGRLNQVVLSGAFDSVKGKTLYREREFLVNVEAKRIFDTISEESVLVQGVIDLLVIDGDTAQIIDYKYSSLSPQSLEQKYQKQLDLYAYAVEKVLGKKVIKKTLVNVFTGETVQLTK